MNKGFPFAGIVDIKDLPAIPANEIDKTVTYNVVYKDLILTQNKIQVTQLFVETKINPDDDDFGTVVIWNNKYYLYNGHHRVVKAALQGHEYGRFFLHFV